MADSSVPFDELSAELYGALRSLASKALGRAARLDPTDVVHQAWLRLAHVEEFARMSRSDFLALCAVVMRRIAVDDGRRRLRGRSDAERITLSGLAASETFGEVDLLALDEALASLKGANERWARMVELRFFGGLSGDEVAEVMGLSRRTVARDWALARAWLTSRLFPES